MCLETSPNPYDALVWRQKLESNLVLTSCMILSHDANSVPNFRALPNKTCHQTNRHHTKTAHHFPIRLRLGIDVLLQSYALEDALWDGDVILEHIDMLEKKNQPFVKKPWKEQGYFVS